MTLTESRFSDLIRLDPNSAVYASTTELLGALDEEPTIAGLAPRAFMNLGRRERHKYAAPEITAMLDLAKVINITEADLPPANESDLLITEHDPEIADKTGSYDFMNSIASDKRQALMSWEDFIGATGRQQIVRRQVLLAEPARPADPRTSFARGIVTLPIIDSDQSNTRRLAQGVARSQIWLEKLIASSVLDSVLEKHQTLHIARSSDHKNERLRGNASAQEMGKYALVRAISEGLLTNAQFLAEVMADSPLRLDISVVAMKAAKEKWVERTARGLPLGIIGPFAVAGYVPKDGLLEESVNDFKLLASFDKALSENIIRHTQLIDIVLGAKAVLDMEEIDTAQLTEGQRSALATLRNMASHIIPTQTGAMEHVIGSGCPAGAHSKTEQSLISMTMQLLAKSLA